MAVKAANAHVAVPGAVKPRKVEVGAGAHLLVHQLQAVQQVARVAVQVAVQAVPVVASQVGVAADAVPPRERSDVEVVLVAAGASPVARSAKSTSSNNPQL